MDISFLITLVLLGLGGAIFATMAIIAAVVMFVPKRKHTGHSTAHYRDYRQDDYRIDNMALCDRAGSRHRARGSDRGPVKQEHKYETSPPVLY